MKHFIMMMLTVILIAMTAIGIAKSKAVDGKVMLYAKPNIKSTIIARISPWQHLIPVYQRGNWVKVGDPTNGMVGWVNKRCYLRVVESAQKVHWHTFVITKQVGTDKPPHIVVYHDGKPLSEKKMPPSISSTFVKITHQNNKPVKITAYENGKKLDRKQALQVYQQLKGKKQAMAKQFATMQAHVQQIIEQSWHQLALLDHDFVQQMMSTLLLPSSLSLEPQASKHVTQYRKQETLFYYNPFHLRLNALKA